MSLFPLVSNMRIASEVAQFCATFLFPSHRHPGLDPGSRLSPLPSGTPDQVRGDDGWRAPAKTRIANKVRQFSELFA